MQGQASKRKGRAPARGGKQAETGGIGGSGVFHFSLDFVVKTEEKKHQESSDV